MNSPTVLGHHSSDRAAGTTGGRLRRQRGSLPSRLLEPSSWARLKLELDLLALEAAVPAALLVGDRGRITAPGASLAAVYAVFVLALMLATRKRTKRLAASAIDACAQALSVCSMAVMFAIATDSIFGATQFVPTALWLWLFTVVSLSSVRAAMHVIEVRARRRGALMTPALVVGAGEIGSQIVGRLQDRPEYGFRPVGYLDADPLPGVDHIRPGVAVLGGPDDLADIARATGARHVILAFSSERDRRMVELVKHCHGLGLGVSVVPRLYESINERATLDHIGGLPVLELRPVDTNGWQFAVKYIFDRLAAFVTLLWLAPVLAAIAIAVRLSSPGPAIFRQRRVGRDGREFDLLKFRTMVVDGDGGEFALADGSAPGGVEGADRRTRVGRWLRNTSLDELPQLLNVLRGEMSLVGPRPERPEFASRFAREVPRYGERHRVKSGITGWAQVNGLRGQTSIADRVEWDNHYIQNWSLGLELRTVALTVAEMFRFRESQQPAAPPKSRTALHVVTQTDALDSSSRWFCGYCGAAPAGGEAPAPTARVCTTCSRGLLLEARADMVPAADEAFLVVDPRLTVQALSVEAERILAMRESDAIDRPVASLFVGADAETGTEQSLGTALARLAAGGQDADWAFVRPQGTFGVRLRAKLSCCGPPRGVLIVLESAPTEPRLRLLQSELPQAAERAQ